MDVTQSKLRWRWLGAAALALSVVGSAQAQTATVTVGRENLIGPNVELWLARGSLSPDGVLGSAMLKLRDVDQPMLVTCKVASDETGWAKEYVYAGSGPQSTGLKHTLEPQHGTIRFTVHPDMKADYAYKLRGFTLRQCSVKPL